MLGPYRNDNKETPRSYEDMTALDLHRKRVGQLYEYLDA